MSVKRLKVLEECLCPGSCGGERGGVFSRFVRGASKAGILGRRGPRERRERRENEI